MAIDSPKAPGTTAVEKLVDSIAVRNWLLSASLSETTIDCRPIIMTIRSSYVQFIVQWSRNGGGGG